METGISGRDWQFWIECFEYEASFVTGNVPESVTTARQHVAANGAAHAHSLSDVDRAALQSAPTQSYSPIVDLRETCSRAEKPVDLVEAIQKMFASVRS